MKNKRKIQFQEETEHILEDIVLWVEDDRLYIKTEVYERENKKDDWFDSMGSQTSIPVSKIKEAIGVSTRKVGKTKDVTPKLVNKE